MKSFKQPGQVMEYANGGTAVSSGDVIVLAAGIAVAMGDIAANASGSALMEGVVSLPKAAEAIAEGAKLYYDASAEKLTATDTGNTPAGYAFKAALIGDAEVEVKLVYAM